MIYYYLLLDKPIKLFIEDDNHSECLRYDKRKRKWVPGGLELWENRVGFDGSEPEDSIYRYGNMCDAKEIALISKEEAEKFIKKPINESQLERLLNLRIKNIDA